MIRSTRLRFMLAEGLGRVSIRDDVPTQLVEAIIDDGLSAYSLSKEELPIRAT